MLSEGAPITKDLCPYHRDASVLKVIQPRRLDSILMPDVAEIPLIDGFRHVANIFWHKYGDIARSISDPEKQRKKDDRYTKHRVDMINFTRERLRNQTPCPLDYIYQETKRRTLEEV